ncbi:DUF4278 domain-containing protein [Lusitaniella coriacea]|uniref:DUF4278 domain-containing protein n=1 Tax=Lusitaniella coriacea TaxID=1983105 RepID=UPI003CE867B4
MQLKYRGVDYTESNVTVDASPPTLGGVYRGVPWSKPKRDRPLVATGIAKLRYRGVEYSQIVYRRRIR